MTNTTLYTVEQYFGTFYDIWDEEYMCAKYKKQLHTSDEWEAIMDTECKAHPEWATDPEYN